MPLKLLVGKKGLIKEWGIGKMEELAGKALFKLP